MLLLDDDAVLPERPGRGEARLARSLGEDGLRAVDVALLGATGDRWSKGARIVFDAAVAGGHDVRDRDVARLHARRLAALVDAGVLEARGDLRRPRWSELRRARAQ